MKPQITLGRLFLTVGFIAATLACGMHCVERHPEANPLWFGWFAGFTFFTGASLGAPVGHPIKAGLASAALLFALLGAVAAIKWLLHYTILS